MLKHLRGATKGRSLWRVSWKIRPDSRCKAGKGQVTCHCCSGEARKSGRFKTATRIVQRYRCKRCNQTFSDAGPLDGLRIEKAKAVQIIKLLAEGLGVRAVARFLDCDPHTVLNVLEVIGRKCDALHDRLARNIATGSIQIDELWARVGVSQRVLTRQRRWDEDLGDQYTFLCLTAREKFIVSYHTGKRNVGNTEKFVSDFSSRIAGRIQITSDAWPAYPASIRRHLLDRLDYAVMQKHFGSDHNNPGDPNVKYSPGGYSGATVEVRAGAPREDRIGTSYVERANLTVRHFNKRFSRLSLGYSKTIRNHRHAISIFVAAYNFCKVHSTLGCTPAVGIGLASETWTIDRLVDEATK